MIDKWILLKNNSHLQSLTIVTLIFSTIIYIIQWFTFLTLRAMDKAEIERLRTEIEIYHERLIIKKLKSTKGLP